jgi:hypothetical protein
MKAGRGIKGQNWCENIDFADRSQPWGEIGFFAALWPK